MGQLNILGPQGHTEVRWRADDELSTQEVQERFDELVREKYLTYKTDLKTHESELIRSFDPNAELITALRPIQGG
jgi:hypothetical protein